MIKADVSEKLFFGALVFESEVEVNLFAGFGSQAISNERCDGGNDIFAGSGGFGRKVCLRWRRGGWSDKRGKIA